MATEIKVNQENGPLENLLSKLVKLGALGLVAAGGLGVVESIIHTNPSILKTVAGRIIEVLGAVKVADTAFHIARE